MTPGSSLSRRRLAATFVFAGALVLAGCSHSDSDVDANTAPSQANETEVETTTAASESFESAELTVVDGKLRRTTWSLADEVYGVPGKRRPLKLESPVHAPLAGTRSAAAAESPVDQDLIAYNAFSQKRPVLRLHDAGSEKDVVLDEGTYSFAWRRDGAIAYFKGLEPRVEDPAAYLGHVVVRSTPRSELVRWTTTPGRYLVSAWAGDRLVVHELRKEWPAILVFDGPKPPRVLADRAALVAISPDGSRALVTKKPQPEPAIALVDIATGSELTAFAFGDEVDPIVGQPINYVADSGAWVSDTVIAAVTRGVGVFRVTADAIALEELLFVHPE
ncbi:MAG: hypothetical protein M3377_02890, partial [Actinomycetota bacterium]|nr:hypothetical protein [Actinomycetota bacterium]